MSGVKTKRILTDFQPVLISFSLIALVALALSFMVYVQAKETQKLQAIESVAPAEIYMIESITVYRMSTNKGVVISYDGRLYWLEDDK